MAKLYGNAVIEGLISEYVGVGGEMLTIEDGVLGHGKLLLHSADGRKSVVVTEQYINEWTSGHTIRMYNELPKKYKNMI